MCNAGLQRSLDDIGRGAPAAAAIFPQHRKRDLRIIRWRIANHPRVIERVVALGADATIPRKFCIGIVGR